ncbi:MAG: HEPN domain-containing protein [bacterium]
MALTPEQKALAKHRFERAETTLKEATDELSYKNFRLTVNRAYYSVFYAMRALLATVDKDSSKHSGVLSLFNQHFIKTGIIPEIRFKAIQSLMDLRHEGDYQDFVEVSEEEAKGAVEMAKTIVTMVKGALEKLKDE